MTRAEHRRITSLANAAARAAGTFGTQAWTDAYQAVLDEHGYDRSRHIAPQPHA